MSEKIRRINKKPLRIPPWVKAAFYIGGGVIITLIGGFIIYRYLPKLTGKKNNNTTVVNVTTESLYAVLCQNEDCFSLDKNGVAYAATGKMLGNLILTLEDKTSRNLKLGDKFLGVEALAKLYFIKENIARDLGLGLASAETEDSNLEDFDFMTDQNWILRVTLRENAYKTLETLKRTLAQIGPSNTPLLEYVDLRIPNKVYFKFRN